MSAVRWARALKILTMTAVVGFSLSGPARAAICAGINLPDTIDRDGTLVLNGMGLRLATIFDLKVYVAGLYVPEYQSDAEEIIANDQKRVLVMVFLRDVSQRTLSKAINEAIEVNAAERDLGPVQDKLGLVPEVLPEVREGQALIFDYAPGYGTAVMLDGEVIAELEGHDFASALMTLWIGIPPNDELKEGLLGGICEE